MRSSPSRAASRLGTAAAAVLVGAIVLFVTAAAGRPSSLVPDSRRTFPAWLSGPLHLAHLDSSKSALIAVMIVASAAYVIVLLCVESLRTRSVWGAIVLVHIAILIGPLLLSKDAFGYIGFARLQAIHGLSPYTHTAAAAPGDSIYPLLGWHDVTTPYGPLFTLASMVLVPLGIAGGVWALKSIAVLASLATLVLVWRVAGALGRSPRAAVAMLGLHPLLLVYAVGGAHNDLLLGLLVTLAATAVLGGHERRAGFALACAVAVKATAVLALPFVLIGSKRRGRAFAAMAATSAAIAAVSLAVFGLHVLGVAMALASEQHQVAGHSIPSQVSKLFGLGPLAGGVRVAFLVALGGVAVAMMWRAYRGTPWLDCYGWTVLALLAATGWLLPWYGVWALLPASLSSSRRLRIVTLGASAYLLAITLFVARSLSSG